MQLSKLLAITILYFPLLAIAENNDKHIFQSKTVESHKYGNIAINTIEEYEKSSNSTLLVDSRISIEPLSPESNPLSPEKPIWIIRTKQLPLTEAHCNKEEVDVCSETAEYCFKPCLSRDVQFLAYDENKNLLYLQAAGADVGTGGGTYFLFIADINKKEIKYFDAWGGPSIATFSPSGKYLLLVCMNQIKIYNLTNNKSFVIIKNSTPKNLNDSELHYLGGVKWLNDDQFTYKDSVFRDKFTHTTEAAVEINRYTVDIPSQKTLNQQVIKAKV